MPTKFYVTEGSAGIGEGTIIDLDDYAVGDGTTDDTTNINNAIAACPAGGTLIAWPGKTYRITSLITVTSLTHFKLVGLLYGHCIAPGAATGDSPKFLWDGAANGQMFYFRSCFNPTIKGFNFNSNVAINGYLKFDDTNVSSVTGTAGVISDCSFVNPTNNTAFIAISICPTANGNNQENYKGERLNFQGAGSTTFAGKDIVGAGTKTITSASNPWVVGQVGKRIRLSYQVPGSNTRGFIDDTIATFNNSGSIVLTTNTVPTQTGITCHVDQCYGVGIQIGNSQNSKHHEFNWITSLNMQTAVACIGGSCDVDHLSGEADDCGVSLGYTMTNGEPNAASSHITEPCTVRRFLSEANRIGVFGSGNGIPIKIENSRIDNTKADARGFFQLTDANINSSGPVTATPGTNQVVIGRIGGFGAAGQLLTRGNIWGMTPSQVGITTWNGYQFAKSQWNSIDQYDDNCQVTILGAALNFSNLPGNLVLGMEQWIADSTTNTWGAVIAGSGGNTVKGVYNGANWTVSAK